MTRRHRMVAATVTALLLLPLVAGAVAGHERREVQGYMIQVGFIDEPAYAGERNGLEIHVTQGDAPVTGLHDTLRAEVIYQESRRTLPLDPVFGDPTEYRAVFYPTAAGAYTFRLFGRVEDAEIDESFTSRAEGGFDFVKDAGEAHFPVRLPPPAELSDKADRGATAAEQIPIAIGLGAGGLIIGLASLGVALAGRQKRS